jgi:DNA topoisomerase-1
MTKSLVIVESPSKAKTIGQYLGDAYEVFATVGHIKNLPEKKLGVDIKNDFIPEYVTIDGKEKIIEKLKKLSFDKDKIFIATDPDREGEAIAWHILEEIKNKNKVIKRVLFNEITKEAVLDGIEHPIDIDNNKVQAQQARRVMDRIVGYKVSPFLWKTIYSGLSAGRVQSVALRLICEREDAIESFKQEEYWSITARLKGKEIDTFDSELFKINGKNFKIPDEESAKEHVRNIKNGKFIVRSITKKETKRSPSPPFTTSTLQQEAAKRFGMSTSYIMSLAQQLYEGVEIKKGESVGLITYMRTDSTRISDKAISEIRNFIFDNYGKEYLPQKPKIYKKDRKIQDAHEAIRPTSFNLPPKKVKNYLNEAQFKLYELIWNRFTACQMNDAILENVQGDIECGNYLFRTTVTTTLFMGFLHVYEEYKEDKSEEPKTKFPPNLKVEMALDLVDIIPKQHFTKPPSRYTESTLVKELDYNGIGRPSTYAIIISNIIQRKYVEKEEKKLVPTELGRTVSKILTGNFPEIFNVEFTSKMEEEFDKIEIGKKGSVNVLRDFYDPFIDSLKNVNSKRAEIKKELAEHTEEKCELCGREMVIKWGKHGKFYACSGYPECKNAKPINQKKSESLDEECPKCGSKLVKKVGRFGEFIACSNYPDCRYTRPIDDTKIEETNEKCPKCNSPLVIRNGRYGKFLACSNYPKCKYIGKLKLGLKCPKEGCGGEIVENFSRKKKRKFYGCSNYPQCDFVSSYPIENINCPECNNTYIEIRGNSEKGEYRKCPKCGGEF